MTTTLRPSGPLQQTAAGARSRPYEIRVNSRRVGALVIATDTPYGPHVGVLRELYVEEPDRRRGRATVAVLAGEEVLRGWGCDRVRISVPADAAGGLRLATALGYTEEGRLMRKTLPAAPPALPDGVRARALTAPEYATWLDRAVTAYADVCADRGMAPDTAAAHSRDDHADLLPDGPDTPGMSVAILEADGEPVGTVWAGDHAPGGARSRHDGWYVYDVEVFAAHRGRGHGRSLLLQAERTALADGSTALGLHRFSANTPAVRLYDSLGYRPLTVNFTKILL
ncbi:GNAT family N-acetyltransferase [Streptomyces bambusae]|uniref:GNAT family N-acetyltransferase n=1 Tax=Streptomyces bambusae TaxID=1550616 RepID=A0ABS6ZFR9_9ACTN|nr:GNAT family N-acetyltransferase [Streptomyces bambusae]MBW5485480.1 GNAT family N-acetyltransferase [Streptomyces bambusae]